MSIYEHQGYFQEYLESKGVDLNNHIELNQFLVDIDYRALISWSEKISIVLLLKNTNHVLFTVPKQ